MTLADTPRTWPNGPSMSTLHVLLIFAGIPLLVILTVSLLVLAPAWVKGPRYRPGQPWDAKSEWFGPVIAGADAADASDAGSVPTGPQPGVHPDENPGGASAGW